MFKLVKIFNSGTNVPEHVYMPVMNASPAVPGSLMCLIEDGYLENDFSNPTRPLYIISEYLNEEMNNVLCYRVTKDMLFEAPMFDGYNIANAYAPLTPYYTNNGIGGVKLAEGEEHVVANLYSYGPNQSGGKTLLTFNR